MIGLEIGDVITKINGQSVHQIIKEQSKYYPASNQPTMLRNLSWSILRAKTESIEIEFTSSNKTPQNKTLKLYPIDSLNIYAKKNKKKRDEKSFKMLDNNIGYVTLQTIQDEDVPKIKSL